MKIVPLIFALVAMSSATITENDKSEVENDKSGRNKKSLSVFEVVSFQNSACSNNGGRNGTCYTR